MEKERVKVDYKTLPHQLNTKYEKVKESQLFLLISKKSNGNRMSLLLNRMKRMRRVNL